MEIIAMKEAFVIAMRIALSTCWMGLEKKKTLQLLPKLFTKTLQCWHIQTHGIEIKCYSFRFILLLYYFNYTIF